MTRAAPLVVAALYVDAAVAGAWVSAFRFPPSFTSSSSTGSSRPPGQPPIHPVGDGVVSRWGIGRTPMFSTAAGIGAEVGTAEEEGGGGGSSDATADAERGEVAAATKATPTAEEDADASRLVAEITHLSASECKDRLLDLIPKMTGRPLELLQIEALINRIEGLYAPALTLDFFNLATAGEWQLLFTTGRLVPPPAGLRLRELVQRVEPAPPHSSPSSTSVLGAGNVTNLASWDLAEDGSTFDRTGTFSVKCSYTIPRGSRLDVSLEGHVLKPIGYNLPSDPENLVGLLFRAMPTEMFDPDGTAFDTTYLDGELRIVRLSGDRYEGVRNIFLRRGALEIDAPTTAAAVAER